MDGRTWPNLLLLGLAFSAAPLWGQQSPWIEPQQPPPVVVAAGQISDGPLLGLPPPPQSPDTPSPDTPSPETQPASGVVSPAVPAAQNATPASLETVYGEAPLPLEQQVADLTKRLAALEKPAPKFPSPAIVSGVFQADGVVFDQSEANKQRVDDGGVGPIENGADFRRARIGVRSALANNMNAFMQMDFAFPGRPTFTDVWVEWTDLPILGTVRAGQWKQPFSLEVVSSFRYTTFMERSSLFQAFTPFRHIGVGFYNHSEDLMSTWAASYLRTGQDQFGDSLSTIGGNGFAGRITQLLQYQEPDGRSYIHVGGAYYLNTPPNHIIAFRSIPEIFVGQNRNDAANVGTGGFAVPLLFDGTPFFVNTGNILRVDHVHTFGVEGLWVYGPLSVQAEAMAAIVDQRVQQTATLDGAYIQVGWFLTGEHRPYDRINGAIDRVKPFEDFFLVRTDHGLERGKGAWEVALRLSHIDLDSGNISGGKMDNFTFGINWYCNPYCKVVFNYIHSWRDSPTTPPHLPPGVPVAVSSEANAFGIRAQMDF